MRTYGFQQPSPGPIPCTVGEVYSYMQLHEGQEQQCYYSSRDAKGEDVWLSMPSPGLVDHAWFQKHLEYPVLLALGGIVLLPCSWVASPWRGPSSGRQASSDCKGRRA